ncbi:MAG: hypothetical protein CMQ33_12030 [Gammaproteobacteria bacterium]|nr:hypothetical protein [Gammaproteobacteria bacterium]
MFKLAFERYSFPCENPELQAFELIAMVNRKEVSILIMLLSTLSCLSTQAQDFTREFDIIYHKQDGFALTMEKIAPQQSNGAAIASQAR